MAAAARWASSCSTRAAALDADSEDDSDVGTVSMSNLSSSSSSPYSWFSKEYPLTGSWAVTFDTLTNAGFLVDIAGPSSTTTKLFCRSRSFHFNVREMAWNQSVDCLSAQTVGKGYLDAVTLMWSPSGGQRHQSKFFWSRNTNSRFNSTRPRPSKLAHAVLRELYGTQIRSSMLSGRSMGRNERV